MDIESQRKVLGILEEKLFRANNWERVKGDESESDFKYVTKEGNLRLEVFGVDKVLVYDKTNQKFTIYSFKEEEAERCKRVYYGADVLVSSIIRLKLLRDGEIAEVHDTRDGEKIIEKCGRPEKYSV